MSSEKTTEKIEAFWENATADDVAGIAHTRKPISARARDEDTGHWRLVLLAGWKLARFDPGAIWIDADGVHWKQCQVYREPAWWLDKPDPGPGFRLLGKFPDEPKLGTDDYWSVLGEEWRPVVSGDRDQHEETWYRRRIEPVEPKFAVGQTVRVVGPKEIPALEWSSVGMAQYAGTTQTIERVELLTNPPGIYYHLGEIDNWCFREDYLEAVEPVEHYLGKVEAIKQFIVGDTFWHPNGLLLKITEKGFEVAQ